MPLPEDDQMIEAVRVGSTVSLAPRMGFTRGSGVGSNLVNVERTGLTMKCRSVNRVDVATEKSQSETSSHASCSSRPVPSAVGLGVILNCSIHLRS